MPQRPMEYKKRICQAMNFISRNLDRELALEEIAAAASFSMFHFHRIFKAVVGETVAGFTRRLRLETTANQLVNFPDKDITTISMDCGFSSSQNFAKAFRRHFGTTPTGYRKSKIGNKDSKKENVFSIQAGYNPDTWVNRNIDKERITSLNVEIKKMPEYQVAYVRKLCNYDNKTHQKAYKELKRWANPRGYDESGIIFGLYWDNPDVTPQGKYRMDICISVPRGTVPEGQLGIQTIKGGLHAVCHVDIVTGDFQEPWDNTFQWIVDKGYELEDRPKYQIFRTTSADHPKGGWTVDICVPLKSFI
ncbi:MAG: helix-turn-helix domain-containing protein [Desulfobacteraceae bacterium]|nr:helix-turn-helix domain-containing protein [Desulfobacteraceae bacterium]